MDRLTLDTNVPWELWADTPGQKRDAVVALLALSQQGKVDPAVTATIDLDIPHSPLAERVAELPTVGIKKIGTVARLGTWQLGRDLLGDDGFVTWSEGLGRTQPDSRDFDHLHAHMLHDRTHFLTWEKPILNLAGDLSKLWGINVYRPDDYLDSRFPGI